MFEDKDNLGLANLSSSILEDKDFPRGQQQSIYATMRLRVSVYRTDYRYRQL